MTKPKLTIVTGNTLKFRELSAKLGEFFECQQGSVDGYEIQGTLEEIVSHKVDHAFSVFNSPVLVDDTGLYFDALGGFPGPYAKDFFKALTPLEMGTLFEGTGIEAISMIGLRLDNSTKIIAKGTVRGVIVKPKDNNHYGREFDLFFKADGHDVCMIEYSPEEKNKFSHRGRAMDDLLSKLS